MAKSKCSLHRYSGGGGGGKPKESPNLISANAPKATGPAANAASLTCGFDTVHKTPNVTIKTPGQP